MSEDSIILEDREVLTRAREPLLAHLPLSAGGYKCSTGDLIAVLLAMASSRGTVEQVCAELPGLPDATTIRTYLNNQLALGELATVEAAVNAVLQTQVPRRIRRHAQDVAFDFHDRPYYGKRSAEKGLWVRGKAKAGTTRFYRIATAYVVQRGQRVTVGVKFVVPGLSTLDVVKALLQAVAEAQITVACLLLDKGFAGVAVAQYLERAHRPAVIACPIHGKTGGTRALCRGRKSYRTTHTFNAKSGATYTAPVVVCRVFITHQRTGRAQRRADWQVFIVLHLDLTPQQTKRRYRRRFGIETSYRCAGQVRGWTTSPNPVLRFLLLGLAFFVQNVWVALQWLFTQVPRRGRRYLDAARFRLRRCARFLYRALEDVYGYVHCIVAPAPPRL